MFLSLSKFTVIIRGGVKNLCLLFGMLFLLGSPQIIATELQSIYEYELPLQEKSGVVDQAQFIQQGITEILVRASGSEKILESPVVKEALSVPDKYVKQVSYHQRPNVGRSIKILFNEKLINQLLSKVPQPTLQKQRPLVLIWLMLEKEGIPCSVGNDAEPLIVSEMSKSLTKRAIPFTFPLLDLTDVSEVAESEVWNGVFNSLQQGARRYDSEAILLGRLKNNINQWQGSWTLLRGNENTAWLSEGETLETLLNEATEALSLKLIDSSSKTRTEDVITEKKTAQRLSIAITGILNMEQYTKVLDYLHQLPSVVEVEVMQIMPEKTVFNLQTTTDKTTLMRSINEGNLLIENPSLLNEGQEELLSYKMAGVY